MDQLVLAAQTRQETGKGAARKLRQHGRIPAVFYGPDSGATMLAVEYSALEKLLKGGTGENILIDLQVHSEDGIETKTTMIKELQTDPVDDRFLHADFYEVSMDKEITVNVAIQLVNTPVGVTKGGMLEHIRRELTVSCLPGKLTHSIDADISKLDIGDSLHVEDIELPEGMTALEDGHLTVAVIAAPAAAEKEEEEEEEGIAAESEETSAEKSEIE